MSDNFNSINTLIVALLWAPDLQNLIKWPSYIQLCPLGGAWPDLTLLVKAKACWLLLVAVTAGYIRYRVTSPQYCSWKRRSTRRFASTEEAPTRAFSWLKVATTAFTFKTLLRHYAKQALTPRSLNVKLGPRRKGHKGLAGWLA